MPGKLALSLFSTSECITSNVLEKISGSGFDGLQSSLVMLTNSRQPFYIGDVAAFTVRADLLQIL